VIEALKPAQLLRRCDPAALGFNTTDELEPLDGAIGQERAAAAIELAIGVQAEGYNLYVMGPPASGRHTLVRRAIAARTQGAAHPPDLAYAYNFADATKPLAFLLPPGLGAQLRNDVRSLVEELRTGIPAVFESEEYASRVESIDAEFKERHEKAFTALGEEAMKQEIALIRTPTGFSFAPIKDHAVMAPEDFAQLPQETQERLQSAMMAFQEKLEKILRESMRWRKERMDRITALNHEMTLLVAGHLVEELKQRHTSPPKVVAWLDALLQDVLDNADDFRKPAEGSEPMMKFIRHDQQVAQRYEINLLVDHGAPDGSPVVEIDHPSYQNLIGRVDFVAEFGAMVTDYRFIRAGALHRANGGYLLLDAARLLGQPFAWEGLKQALLRREIRIESLADMYSLNRAVSLEPEPVPLNVKVVLFGDRRLYYLLQEYDPDFGKFFRVSADFEDDFPLTPDNLRQFARLAATLARREKLLALEAGAVARLVELSSRRSEDAGKLSTDLRMAASLLTEGDHYARAASRTAIAAADVQRAADAARERAERIHKRHHEAMLRGTLLIDTEGAHVGQINGLTVFTLGEFAFGSPSRITATTHAGDGKVLDIQREVQLGGPIHSKGVMILAGYLTARFSASRPLSLSATLVFEQTYGHVEGDSASLAELCTLLSSIAGVPLLQSLAVTGSVNQRGEVQAIGAVNDKIEGFFDLCNARTLSGSQGVIIPASNVEHLMLREDVVAAAEAGRFHIYAVRSVDEAIELLTGLPAGDPVASAPGAAPTVNGLVAARLQELGARRHKLVRSTKAAPRHHSEHNE
jgi:predicted ATP-dependent protease